MNPSDPVLDAAMKGLYAPDEGPLPNGSARKGIPAGGPIWKPMPISQLQRVAAPDTWIWDGFIAPGKITLLSAEAKAGKTTLLALLYQRMAQGGTLCGSSVYPGRVIVVSEEPADFWIDRRERLGLGDHVEVLPMPFITKPTQDAWEHMIHQAARALKEEPAALVVWDTLSHLWWVVDENDNAKEAAALMPLRQLCSTGAALVLVHHFGAERNGPRGGTELRGFPDLLAELHLVRPGDFENRGRILKVRGRLQQLPRQLAIELNEEADDYQLLEGSTGPGPRSVWVRLQQIVPPDPHGWSAEEFLNSWPAHTTPKLSSINNALTQNWASAGWQRTGPGTKKGPYRYWMPKSPPG